MRIVVTHAARRPWSWLISDVGQDQVVTLMSLLREIQSAAIDTSTSLESLLRRCRVLASRLKHDELKLWVQRELDGYFEGCDVPEYRRMRGNCYGHFSGPFGSGLRNAPIPEICIPENVREQLTHVEMREGVAALEQLLKGSDGSGFQIQWPGDASLYFGQKIYKNQNLVQGWIAVPTTFVAGILSTVRNRVLNFALEIEAQNPEAGEAPADSVPIPKESVSQIFNNYIYGNVGNVASGQGISQIATITVKQGDFSSLAMALRHHGIGEVEIEELSKAVQKEGKPKGESFGPRVSEWIGKMVSKAAQGTLKFGTAVAANLLSAYIKSYYGI